jgi:uncharacterized protein (TIGR00369 family)
MSEDTFYVSAFKQGFFPRGPILDLIGFDIRSLEVGEAKLEFNAEMRHSNPAGILHGGVISAISDEAMALAYLTTLSEGETPTTLELKINYLKTIRTAKLLFEGHVVQKGKSLGLVECKTIDLEGNLVAFATCTCMTRHIDR